MAVTTPLPNLPGPPAPHRQRPTGLPDTVPVRSPASPTTQLLAAAAVLVVFAALAAAVEDGTAFAYPTLALVGGVALGLGLDLRAAFRTFPGLAWAAVAFLGLTVVWVWAASQELLIPFWVVAVFTLFVVGLDWAWAERLRVVVVLAGLAVLPFVGRDLTPGLVAGLAWFTLAAATLWSARRDVAAALPSPAPLPGTEGVVPPARPTGAVLGLVASWVVAGLVVATLGLLVARAQEADRPDDLQSFDQVGPGALARDTDGDGIPDTGRDLDGDGRADPDVDGDGRADFRPGPGPNLGPGVDGDLDGDGIPDDLQGGGAPSTFGPGGPPSTVAGGGPGPQPGADRPDPGSTSGDDRRDDVARWATIALGLVGVAIVVALALVIGRAVAAKLAARRARAARPWAVRLAERLEHEGRLRDRPRRRSEPVTHYADALATGVLPDPRLHDVGGAVSAALFSAGGLDDGVGAWAESVVDEVTASYPVATRWDRVRIGRAGRHSRGSAT